MQLHLLTTKIALSFFPDYKRIHPEITQKGIKTSSNLNMLACLGSSFFALQITIGRFSGRCVRVCVFFPQQWDYVYLSR